MTSKMRSACAIAALLLVTATSPLAGQRSAPARAPSRTEVLFLGTAGGPPLRAERSEPATLLIVDGRRYLIDCGIGTARRLVEAGIASETIGTIFFTHLHADHTLGLANVLANDYQQKDAADAADSVNIYGPPQTTALVDAAYQYIAIPYAVFAAEGGGPSGGPPTKSPVAVHTIDEGVVYRDDKITVVAAENTHYALMPQGSRTTMKSYAFRFQTPHGTIVFTGDTGPSDAVVRLAKGADVLVSEVEDFAAIRAFVDRMAQQNHWSPARRNTFEAHMTREHLDINDVGQMAAKAGVNAVVLYHWDPGDPAAYVAGVAKYFPGRVFASGDLQRYCLGPSSPEDQNGHRPLHLCE